MSFFIGLLLVAAPTWFYAWLVRRIDRYEPEPTRYLVAAFLWGALPAIIAGVVIEIVLAVPVVAIFGPDSNVTNFVTTAVFAPIVEEVLKGMAVAAVYLWRRREFDGWIDGIVYGSTVGFGFAFVENIGYLYGTTTTGEWWQLYFLRVLVFGFMHGFWTSLTGIGFGLARNRSSKFLRSGLIVFGLFAAVVMHMLHNASMVLAQVSEGATICISGLSYLLLIVLMIALGAVGGWRERSLMREHLRDELPEVIDPRVYEALVGASAAARSRLGLSPAQQRALLKAACELAFAKRRAASQPFDAASAADVERLREQLRTGPRAAVWK
ncbi:MAG: PrsW family intramembrane metalloprotease [Chloroflexi bacterium]|nr:PrsW family intramembrane metalloprotease [Chloroflexota bacterium]